MLRKLGLSIVIASALLAGKASALGMGEIRVKSALNEPLHAEIALFQVKDLSPLQIKSKMADLNDFALSGLATQRALSDVRFQIRVRANGTGRIILTSKLPVTEPFMNFLVEVNWPTGRLIREYTLLLDPPASRSVQNQRNFNIAQNTVSAADNATVTKPAKIKVPSRNSKTRKAAPSRAKSKKGQYYIDAKDTLWDVAIATRPKKSVTPQQMMVLIQRKNPQAFPNANINVMKARTTIDLPTQAEIDALSVKDAQDEVTRQTKLWKNGNLPKIVKQDAAANSDAATEKAAKESMQAAKDKADNAADKDKEGEKQPSKDDKDKDPEQIEKAKQAGSGDKQAATEKGMIDVITPEEAARKLEMQTKTEAMALAASKDSTKIAELLKNNAEMGVKLALSEESMDKLKRDNSELNDKLNTIVKQLDDINRLIMLKDEQLAAMQDERDQVEKEQDKKSKVEDSKSWLDRLLENPLGMAAAGIGWLFAVVAGVFLLLRRKKKEVAIEEDGKSEPSISMPEDFVEAEQEESLVADADASKADVDEDLDLDLDLDMDMDLDESLSGTSLDMADDEEPIDNEDLAAELEAQLETADDDDDEFDLDGIDSSEFDLGDAPEELDEEGESEAEKQALAEFAAAMEETAPDASEDVVLDADDELEIESGEDDLLEELDDELEIESGEDDLLEELDDELLEGLDDELLEASIDDELELDAIPDQVTSLEEMEELNQEEDLESESLEDIESELQAAAELPDIDDELEIELNESIDEIDLQAEEDTLAQLDDDELLESLDEDLADSSLELEDELVADDLEQAQIGDIESDLLDIELDENVTLGSEMESIEDESIPMDSSLDDLLTADLDVASDSDEVQSDAPDASEDASQLLNEEINGEVNELLSSTDDEIAFDAVEPQFDADNEEDIDLLAGEDGVRMKLDLARAYIEMGDSQGAQDIINEVIGSGDEEQQKEANDLLQSMSS